MLGLNVDNGESVTVRQQLELGIGLAITDSQRRIARQLEIASTVNRASSGRERCNVTEETRTLRWLGTKSLQHSHNVVPQYNDVLCLSIFF